LRDAHRSSEKYGTDNTSMIPKVASNPAGVVRCSFG
jgi:hypothetical protein